MRPCSARIARMDLTLSRSLFRRVLEVLVQDPKRRAALAHALRHFGIALEAGEVDARCAGYLDKIALAAYRITDEDVSALRAAGVDEDAIYDVTVTAAFGA